MGAATSTIGGRARRNLAAVALVAAALGTGGADVAGTMILGGGRMQDGTQADARVARDIVARPSRGPAGTCGALERTPPARPLDARAARGASAVNRR